jgi:amino acid adenylation domain-containing protein
MIESESLEAKKARLSDVKRALLARRIRDSRTAPAAAVDGIRRRGETGPAPLSFSQQRLWFLDQLAPGSTAYNCATVLRLDGSLDIPALRASLDEIVRRHEALRSVISLVAGEPVQRVLPADSIPVPVIDLSALGADASLREARRRVVEETGIPFRLSSGPLLRARLLRLDDSRHVLLLTVHHIVWDGWSAMVFYRELVELYRASSEGRSPSLPEPTLQYADYATWQRRWMTGDVFERQLGYWRAQLASPPPALALHPDRARPAVQTNTGQAVEIDLPEDLADSLRELALRGEATLFMVLLAAYQTLLCRLASQDDILIGTSIAGRNRVELDGLIGFFVNTLVLRGDLSGDPSWRDFLGRVRETAISSFAHEDLPFEKLVEELQPERSLSRSPFFQAAFTFQNFAPPRLDLIPGLTLDAFDSGGRSAKFELTLDIVDLGRRFLASLEYNSDLFEAVTAKRMAHQFLALCSGLAADPSRPISQLPLLGEPERHQLLVEWKGGDSESLASRDAALCLHELFAAQAARTPEAVALVFEEERLSFAELDRRAEDLADRLGALGVGPDARVGVCLERSAELVMSLLAILKAGGAYVPLDPDLPPERLRFMLTDSDATVLLTKSGLLDRCQIDRINALCLDQVGEAPSRSPARRPAVTPDNLAYVIYTSGSTGRPKGVMVPHRGLVNYLRWCVEAYEAGSGEGAPVHSSIGFDLTVTSLWSPLLAGRSVFLLPGNSPAPVLETAAKEGFDFSLIKITPAHLEVLEELLPCPDLVERTHAWVIGGEALRYESLARWLSRAPAARWINEYGPTETVVGCCVHEVAAGDPSVGPVPIGRPVAGTRVHVVDRWGGVAPAGVPGELWLGGVGVTRGYLGLPELTAERFVPDLWANVAGERLYRTGDLVRYRADGALEYLGRTDHQVKVRGFRIELGEIEEQLVRVPGVSRAVVVVREDLPGDRRIVAYAVAQPGSTLLWSAVRPELAQALPEYMLPAALVVLEALPLTPNGKVDRRALPVPERPVAVEVAPRTPVEELVAEIWADVLGVEQVGVEESFFDLGGHSLLATRVISRLRTTLGVELPLRALFEQPTVAGLAARVETALRADTPAPPPLVAAPRTSVLPLSFAQQRLWFIDRLEPGSAAYNIPAALRLVGNLRLEALEAGLSEVVRRHEAVRTRFLEVADEAAQVVDPPAWLRLPLVDLSGLPFESREREARRQAAAEAARPFDLSSDRLLRSLVLRLASREHVALVTLHHIVSDGWSTEVLIREVAVLYGVASGEVSPLPELPVQYADFAVWQRGWLAGEVLAGEVGFWRKRLAGLPAVLELPTDRPRPPAQSFQGASRSLSLGPELTAALRALSRREGATLFITMLASFQALLSRWSGQDDFAVGSPVAGRTRQELEGLIGFFVNTLVLRADMTDDPPLRSAISRAREGLLEAHAHQDLPFEKLVEELRPERSLSHSPLFQVMFTLQERALPVADLGEMSVRSFGAAPGLAKFDLTFGVDGTGEAAACSLEYSTDLFDAATAARLLAHWSVLLDAAVAEPGRRVSQLALLAAAERHQLLREWNGDGIWQPSGSYAGLCLHQLFEAQAARTPAAVALVFQGERLTYAELDGRAERIATHLVDQGVGPETRVALWLERSPMMVEAILGILKSGGAYVPLDPSYPVERLEFMLEDSRAALLLTQESLAGRALRSRVPRVSMESLPKRRKRSRSQVPAVGEGNLAYAIYTSGSTGRPKAVGIEHRNAVAFLEWSARHFSPRELQGVLASTSICFDLSIFELFVPLCHGGTVILVRDVLELPALAGQAEVILLNTVPSALAELMALGGLPASVRTVNVAGEPLTASLVTQVYASSRVERVMNLYGPSEDTTYSTYARAEAGSPQQPAIGRPLTGTRAYVADRWGTSVPAGVPGELFLGGAGLARGYLGRPELTAERFVPDSWADTPGERLYRTGDLARYRADGALEYLGRLDHQVKVRGFRIELGEIEERLARVPGVNRTVVVVREDHPGDRRLVAYAVAQPGSTLLWSEVRRVLAHGLPEYMLPSALVVLETLPLTPNGKVDRRALPAPERWAAVEMAPRTPVEELVAEIWADVLGVERVGVEASFFDLGGHSLLATRVISRLRTTLGIELPLRALFEQPTVAGLAARVETALRGDTPAAPPIGVAPRTGALPLSFAQQRLWFIDRLEPGSAAYNIPAALRLEGDLRLEILAAVLSEVMRRHEALRTRFVERAGEAAQVVEPPAPLPLPLADLSGLPFAIREREARRQAAAEAARPFDLSSGPLLRSLVLRLASREHVALVTLHHIVSDGWSTEVLIREVATLYRAALSGEASPLPELAIQYADFAVWQREWLAGDVLAGEVAFWRERLAGLPAVFELPTDRPRPPAQSFRGASLNLSLGLELTAALRALSRREGATLFITLLASFQALLSRWSGQDDFAVGSPVAGRTRQELEGLIGFFVNTLVLRSELADDPPLRTVIGRTRESLLEIHAHQDLPFEKLVEELRPDRNLSHSPLFQVMFTLRERALPEAGLGELSVRPFAAVSMPAKFDLTLAVDGSEAAAACALEFATDLFDAATAARLLAHWVVLLGAAVTTPDLRVSRLTVLTPAESHQLLVEWKGGDSKPFASRDTSLCLHELFAAQAARTPEAVAVVFEEEQLSYTELDRRAEDLADRLGALDVGLDARVGVCLERSAELIVALLAILKAGGAYVPLDPDLPFERLRFMLTDSGAVLLLTASGLLGRCQVDGITTLCLDQGGEALRSPARRPAVTLDNLAYVIYTSGSTGRPKGVMVPHRGLVNYLQWCVEAYQAGSGGGAPVHSSIGFDLTVTSLWSPLLAGRSVFLLRGGSPVPALEVAAREGADLSLIKITPAHLEVLDELLPNPDLVARARVWVIGGEALRYESIARWRSRAPDARWINEYGPTETVVGCCVHEIAADDPSVGPVPIGRPVAGTRVHVVDRWGGAMAAGVLGELWLGGIGVARGYLGRPELTAERFVPDPWADVAGERLYRTGDLVRYRADGALEYLGRTDHQVKVRGFRIELGEIEERLARVPGVNRAVVVVREDLPGDRRLVAYAVAQPGSALLWSEVRPELAHGLPEYMLPSVMVVLEALPLTPNGKVDRRALPAPERPAAVEVAPRTPVEELVAEIWADVLGIERAGMEESFFDLGGHSLLAMRMVSRLRTTLGVELPLRALFEQPTVAGLAARVEAELRGGAAASAPIAPLTRQGPAPLSFAQQRLWFIDQLEPDSPLYNVPVALRVAGALSLAVLARCLGEIVRRHEMLRTTFSALDGEPVQSVQPAAPLAIPVVDLSHLPEPTREALALALAGEEAVRPFDLAHGPLLRVSLLRMAAGDHVVRLAMHHIVSDGWSMGLLVHEVSSLYGAYMAGRPSPLPDLRVQYADFAVWQRDRLRGEVLETQMAYWRRQLAGLPPLLELPTDRPRSPLQSVHGGLRRMPLPAGLVRRVQALGRREGSTPFMVLLAVLQVLLARYSGQPELAVGTPVAGRNRQELEGLIGFFVNTLVLRGDLTAEPSFRELLLRVRETALAAHTHQEVPFEKLVEELAPERSLVHSPFFQVMFSLDNVVTEKLDLAGLSLRSFGTAEAAAKFDLSLAIEGWGGDVAAAVEYRTALFDGTTIDRLLHQLVRLAEAAVDEGGLPALALPLLSAGERSQLLTEWNDTATAFPRDLCLHQLFEAQAARTPEMIAVEGEQGRLTYRDLDDRAGRLAAHLRGLGVGPEVVVGICVERSVEMIVALFGVLKAGGAYLPLDLSSPPEHLEFLLRDAGAAVLLTQERLLGSLAGSGVRTLCLDRELTGAAGGGEPPVSPRMPGPDNLAYLMYTSGSTGRPKGVSIQHRSAVWYTVTAAENYGVGASDRVLQFASFGFDISVEEIFPVLSRGGTLVISTDAMRLSTAHFLERSREWEITAFFPATAFWHELSSEVAAHPEALPPSVRLVCIGGERVLPEQVRSWQRHVDPRVQLFNSYGPTETTVVATLFRIDHEPAGLDVPIGRPIRDARTYILDPALEPQPLGVLGELCIGGAGLARGYRGDPAATAARLMPDPFSPELGARLYRTGDRARFLPSGELSYAGRVDQQIKIRGFRVEPGEIETALTAHSGVREAIVLAREDTPGNRRLVAYVAGEVDGGELQEILRARLPAYMVPSAFVILDSLPLTANSKVDRRALPAPERPVEGGRYLAPRTPVEAVLAGIWSEVLGLERVGALDDFFELGGHSLLATRVISRLRAAFQVEVPLRELFQEPTVAGLSLRIEAAIRDGAAAPPPIVPVPRTGPLPLSFAQQRLWFIDRLEPGGSAYNLPMAIRLEGDLRPAALAAALSEVVRRQEALRTRFVEVAGEAAQVIDPPVRVSLPVVDLSGLPVASREREAGRQAAAEAARPFDLSSGPLLRAAVLRLASREHGVLVTLHHIVSDGWSMEVLIREVAALYGAALSGEASPLPEPPIQYTDFAVWQREWLTGEVLAGEVAFWRERLAGLPAVLELPTDRPRPLVRSSQGATRDLPLSPELTAALRTLSRREGATLFMTLLAAFQALLSRWSGQEDFAVGSPVAGRTRQELEGLVGFFVNTLVLRAELGEDPSLRALIGQAREGVLTAHAHQDLPFEKLVEELRPERNLSHTPLFQVMFTVEERALAAAAVGELSVLPFAASGAVAKFDLTLGVNGAGEAAACSLEYSTDLFDATTAARLLGHWSAVLATVVAEPGLRVSQIDLLGPGERHQIVHEWTGPGDRAAGAEGCLHELFEAQAARTPDAVAVVFEAERVTYAELDRRAERIAAELAGRGVGPETRVALWMERSSALVAAILGILKSGGAYIPLDPSYPAERLELMLGDSGAVLLLTQESLARRPLRTLLPIMTVEPVESLGGRRARSRWQPAAGASNLAYAIYTSGSTGRPKAVGIEHRSAVALMHWSRREFSDLELSGVLASTSIAFDMSVFELFAPLSWGGTVILAGNALALPELAAAAEVRLVDTVPSAMAELLRLGGLPRSVVTVNLGGEAVPRSLADRVYAEPGVERLYNLYGPSEDTTFSTWALIERESWRAPSIGRPLDGSQAWVVDRHLQPVPVGVAGELYLGGHGVSRGYLGRPELTAERFLPDPFAAVTGSRMYRVGDLTRYRPDGSLEFLGRVDHQVKVRGFRVELGEIEDRLAGIPGVSRAVVVAREDRPGDRRLVAYAVPQPGAAPPVWSEVRLELARSLPEYMLPSALVLLEALPLTQSGKVDRRALRAPERQGMEDDLYQPPRTPVEGVLAGIWSEVLGLERVGARDNFFALGGHSLLATRVLSRLRGAFQVELPLRDLFEEPTIAGLSKRIEAASRAGAALPPPIMVVPRTGPLPLSFAQQRLWFIDRLEPGSAAYNIPEALRLEGDLRLAALAAALSEVARRQEALRTRFLETAGEAAQVVDPPARVPLPVVDLSALPVASRELEACRQAAAEAARPFDLSTGPLLRAAVLRLAGREHVVLVTLHHIVSDGWSMEVLIREVAALYGAAQAEEASPLPEPPVQYADFTVWQREWLAGEVLAGEVAFWRERLAGLPAVLELPTDRPRPPAQSFHGASRHLSLAPELTAALRAASRREGATLFMTLLAAFQVLLSRWSGQEDFAVGSPVAGRGRQELEGLIGFFVSTLVLRAGLGGDPPLRAVIARAREGVLTAHAHQDLPFEKLVEELRPERSLSHTPLFQVMFALRERALPAAALGELSARPFGAVSTLAKFDLTLGIDAAGESAACTLEYATALFDPATAARLLSQWAILLEAVAGDPALRLSQLSPQGEPERHQVLHEWNDTGEDWGRWSAVHERVLAQAEASPEAQAVAFPGGSLSYGELADRGRRFAGRLVALGVGPEARVAVCLERSPEMVVALLAVLVAGGCYVPLDPALPDERLAYLLRDCGARVLLTREELGARCASDGLVTIYLERAEEADAPPLPEPTPGLPDQPAYVVYTSGSTGRPKGVVVSHGALANLALWHRQAYGIRQEDRATHLAGLGFDAAVWELWPYLAAGARIAIPEEATRSDPEGLRDWLAAEGITWSFLPTPLAEAVLGLDWPADASLRGLLTGGDRLRRRPPTGSPFALINHYGPTESCVVTTRGPVPARDPRQLPPIGRPIANVRVYVLDAKLAPVPLGCWGELGVAGAGLARGYLGRPDLTAASFVPDAQSGSPGARLYRTGDVVRHLPDGNLEFQGRRDDQVKVRGVRIELGEVEAALERLGEVAAAVVLAPVDPSGAPRLVAYAVARPGCRLVWSEMRAALVRSLPESMLPSGLVVIEALPQTPNGKVDRRALAAALDGVAEHDYLAPRDVLELGLVRIWEELMDSRRPIGVRDSFFAVGGHSLLAVRLMSRIEEAYGRRLPLATLFENPSIERLAHSLRERGGAPPSTLIELRGGVDAAPPLALVHPVGGDVFCYGALARHLGAGRAVLAFRSQGLDGESEPLADVETMAASYVGQLQARQPRGPYLLGGWSIGGLIAWEMARQLEERGERVGLLALLDSWALPQGDPDEDDSRLLAAFADNLGLRVADFEAAAGESAALGRDERLAFLLEWAKLAGTVPPDLGLARIRDLFRVFTANAGANHRYRPVPGATPVQLWRAAESAPNAPEPTLGWSALALGGLEIHDVPGDHFAIVREPQVQIVSRRLTECLRGFEEVRP